MMRPTTLIALVSTAVLAACQPAETNGSFEQNVADAAKATTIQVGLLNQGREIGALCIANLPDGIQTRRAIRSAGFSVVFADGDLSVFARDSRELLAFVNNQRSDQPGCGFAIRNMSVPEAEALGASIAEQISAERFILDDADAPTGWIGEKDGQRYGIVVRREFSISGLIRGAAIVVTVLP